MSISFFRKVRIASAYTAITLLVMTLSLQAIAATQYEAENATLSGGANRNTNHGGYSGTGFIDGYYNSTTAQTSFSVSAPNSGGYTITLRYSAGNGTSTNTGLYVNGVKIKNITCNATSNWDTWANEVETVTLNAGNNTIAYKAETSSGSCINLDYISVANQTWLLTMANDGHGSTNPSGTVTVNSGAATSIIATAASGYQFVNWTVTSGTASIASSSSASTTVTLTSGNATVRANFSAITYSLTMSNDGHGTTTPSSGTVTVNYGVATPISATAASGYQFVNWTVTSGTASIASPSSASTTVTLTSGNATVQANFIANSYSLTMTNDGHGTTTPSGTVTVNYGAATPISATPATGYQFVNWTVTSGTASIASPSSASTTVTLTSGNATVQANFTAITYSLTVSNDGHGTTTPSGSIMVNYAAITPISATPATGYQFVNWTVTSGTASIASPSSASTTVTLTSGNATVQANFTANSYSLTMTNDGHGTTTPSGTVTVNYGAATPITAAAASGYYFVNWTVTGGTATIAGPSSSVTTVTLTSGNATIRANFAVGAPASPTSRQISISGMLYDQNGRPVGSPTPTTVEMTVRLFSQATGGDTMYREDFLVNNSQSIPVDSGVFVARLGTGATRNDLYSVIAANANLWAEITVLGAQPDVLMPRTPLTASPYALSVPTAAAADKTLHGKGSPIEQSITAPVGSYYVNDSDGTTWVRINNGWRMMD